jgi:hypothetical protein
MYCILETVGVTNEPMNKQVLILHDPVGEGGRDLRDVAQISGIFV